MAGVGNGPTWQDGGPEGRYREYWTSYGFGELGQGAETRRLRPGRPVPVHRPGGGARPPGAETGYLPFEGDRTLALILGKAVVPADDTGITDPTITRQILRERA
ncbi:hypothetical protein OG311_23180 [Streptomyces sp. NBC_01343]|uniref:DUF7737 domain-containing protein n=1 Tax=Streptomyces sp. NBC_01343 TaxID=2903832 RepID=UPI002E1646E2|nr:hypothetical protein OG311_23180 [Streptomyces sp. NBC_01343]